MATEVPAEDHDQYPDRGWSPVLHPSGPSQVNRGRLHLGVVVQEMTQALVSGYNGIQAATASYIQHASETTTPAESVDLESQPASHANQQQDVDSAGEPGTTPGNTLHNHTNPVNPETDEPEEASDLATLREDHSGDTGPARPKRTWWWVLKLVDVLLLLIMAPGLIVGIATRNVAWGIATSGAFAPVVVFFGGLYYHHNR